MSAEEEFQEIFAAIDADGNGFITTDELQEFMESVCDRVSEEQIAEIFEQLDLSGDRKVNLQEFTIVMENFKAMGWKRLLENVPDQKVVPTDSDLRKIFEIVDKDGNGSINRREARKAVVFLKERLGIEQVEDWMRATDVDSDGVLTFEEFKFSIVGNTMVDSE